MRGSRWQYTILALLLAAAAFYEAGNIGWVVSSLRNPAETPAAPFSIRNATRTIGSGPLFGDQILALNGHPFTAKRQFDDAVAHAHPGDRLHLVLSEPSGRAIEKMVVIGSQTANYTSTGSIALTICLDIFVPLVCIALGFGVAFIRPRDVNAWLLMFLLTGFGGLLSATEGNSTGFAFIWIAFCNSIWAIAMLLFSIYFPTRFEPDRRYPWFKYVFLVPAVGVELTLWGILWIWRHDISIAQPFAPFYSGLSRANLFVQMCALGGFFAVLGTKSGMEKSPDDRRRLRILRIGASLSFTPMFPIVLYALVRHSDVLAGVPWPLTAAAFFMMALFPVTLAYVIVVERAMDLSFVVRQSVKYGLAKGGLWALRAFFIGLAIYVFSNRVGKQLSPVLVGGSVAALVIVRRKNTEKASAWLDRKFFREAYDAETVLSELAGEVGRYVEIDPLFETVARRISETMHVPDIVILVREGAVYRTRYSTRMGPPLEIPARSRLLSASAEQGLPITVYLDKPQPWLRTLDAEELQALSFMRSELLLVLRGRGSEEGQVIGIMSLGPKKSEVPYSKTDSQLLQTIAVQMGMALQNSRLAASLADETAHREVMNRELEIAREVQERLFPQTFPKIAGIDCFGYCRPARGVGGDYFDVLELPEGRLGIAIGDVSGKGIPAALLMASLQASLRGQTMAGVRDLAELMRNVNKLVYDASQSNRYATFFYGEFDTATWRFAYVNAGHNAPVILRGTQVLRLEACGPVVGLLPGVNYQMEACQMHPGDLLIGYTDGISEAMNEQDEEWEEERFIAAARASSNTDAKQLIDSVFRSADSFTGAARQYDDMTLLVMKLVA